ncbi:farnesyl-diphosphate synthase, partial [candidate division KSB3 bacterium]
GKTAGKDEASDKSTYPAVIGLDASRKEAARLTHKALKSLQIFRKKSQRLEQIARYLLEREY